MNNEEIIEMALSNFGMYVRQTRVQYGMSLQDLARKTNLSAAFIYRIEVGTRRAYVDTRLVILLCGFNWDTNLVMSYLERIVNNVKQFKRIPIFE
jgi:transcriptional regulator with XRE-family HTH domain